MDLQDKVIVITGGAGGLGSAMAEHLGKAGAIPVLVDTNAEALETTKNSLAEQSVNAKTYVSDITDEESVEELFQQINCDAGRLDGLINNAGIIRDNVLVKVENGVVTRKMTMAQWQAVINVNLTGVFLCGREAAGVMALNGNGGCIVNIASISAMGNMGQTNYSATKAGVIAMAVTWSKELAKYGIRAAAISPGFVRTPLLEGMKQEALQMLTNMVPLKRMAEPSEVAQSIEYIFRNDYYNGRVIELDGGLKI